MKITNIEQQKKNKNRMSIYIDNEYAFGLNISICEKYNLKKDMEITEEFVEEVLISEERNKAVNQGLKFLTASQKTEKEVREKLGVLDFEKDIIEYAVGYLKEQRYINDEQYTESFINDQLSFSKDGRRKIRTKLYRKGIDMETIDRVISVIDDNVFVENALSVARKRLKTMTFVDEHERDQKIFRFLFYKGYDFDIVKKAVGIIDEEDSYEN
ncbi:regulatory protein [Dethiosulfatibacter aminovorans DSM 17477]|uniref:Regulatory protein RecX n=1 Tax=Dethiosulfatibacter aminovorans DSM 17477 TaxID=1121476 RepID=A0A1M6I2B5_9FIRM|nr:RecX family transcriptional regulator [Dethiosulfatibacter aminovorans]SHJ28596.1 regulatory protein [Dethiosulfatibacter aminovorans DSM 17477]